MGPVCTTTSNAPRARLAVMLTALVSAVALLATFAVASASAHVSTLQNFKSNNCIVDKGFKTIHGDIQPRVQPCGGALEEHFNYAGLRVFSAKGGQIFNMKAPYRCLADFAEAEVLAVPCRASRPPNQRWRVTPELGTIVSMASGQCLHHGVADKLTTEDCNGVNLKFQQWNPFVSRL